jgi:hypothetical protein
MSKISASILPLLLVFQLEFCLAQETPTIPKPLLEIQGENLFIKYNIINSKPGEKYTIKLEVTDSKGSIINSQSLTGDIGDSIQGGNGKKIIWHYTSDNVKDEVQVYITIALEKHPEKTAHEEFTRMTKHISRGSLFLQSIAIPGLGLSKIKNKPYWIMGIAGYGLITASIIFKSSSNSSHDNFLNTNNPVEEDYYIKKYRNQKSVSTICLIGAAAIWVADLIVVASSSSKLKYTAKSDHNYKLLIRPDYNLTYKAPILNFNYIF